MEQESENIFKQEAIRDLTLAIRDIVAELGSEEGLGLYSYRCLNYQLGFPNEPETR